MIVHNRTYTCCIATYINSTYSCSFSLSAALCAIFFIFYFIFLLLYLLCFLLDDISEYTCCIFAFLFVASIDAIFRPLPALNHSKYRCYTFRSRLSAGIHATFFNSSICSYRCNVFSFWILNVAGIDAICSERPLVIDSFCIFFFILHKNK